MQCLALGSGRGRFDVINSSYRKISPNAGALSSILSARGIHVSCEDRLVKDEILDEPHRPQFESAPNQARKTASFYEAIAAAIELKPMVGVVRRIARERRAALSRFGKMALPPEQR